MMTDQKYMVKNRYIDILVYEHSRITLKPRGHEKDPEIESYINANYVDVSDYWLN